MKLSPHICEQCRVPLEDYDGAYDSHFKCPKCHKVLFQDGEGELKILGEEDLSFEGQEILNRFIRIIDSQNEIIKELSEKLENHLKTTSHKAS